MAELLTGRGYFVALEPNILMPPELLKTRRQPDVLVLKKGRIIALEIDDSTHLVGTHKGSSSKVPNVPKYIRDREQDRVFLANGIPILRIYYTEFQQTPHQVVSYLESVYESLGGQRLYFS